MASSEQLRSNLSEIRPIRELCQLCHVEKGRIRFAGGVNFLRNESRTRNEHSWHRSGGADEPRISFPIPIVFSTRAPFSIVPTWDKKRARKEWREVCAHTRGYWDWSTSTSEYYSSGSALPFIRHCPRTLCGNARE